MWMMNMGNLDRFTRPADAAKTVIESHPTYNKLSTLTYNIIITTMLLNNLLIITHNFKEQVIIQCVSANCNKFNNK